MSQGALQSPYIQGYPHTIQNNLTRLKYSQQYGLYHVTKEYE